MTNAVDRDSFTPLTSLASRQALELTIRDVHAHDGQIGSMAKEVAETKALTLRMSEALAAHLRDEQTRPRMSSGQIKAWGGVLVTALTVLVGGVTQWRVEQAGAASRSSAEVTTAQEYERRAATDRQKTAELTASETARRTADEVRRAIREEQAEAERRAAMRKR